MRRDTSCSGGSPNWFQLSTKTCSRWPVTLIRASVLRDLQGRWEACVIPLLVNPLWRWIAAKWEPAGKDLKAAVISRQIQMDDFLYTVVGVMPPGFTFIEQPTDVFVPLQLGRGIADTGMNTRVIARLKRGTTAAQAQANINLVFERFRKAGSAQSGQRGIRLESYQKWLAGDFRTSILMLFGAVGLLLLIACSNVASLLMAPASARQREISIRLALGAGRSRLLQQFLSESLLIALIGGLAGVLVAGWALKALIASVPWDIPLAVGVGLNTNVLAFTLLLVVGTSLVFGFTSYWQVSRLDLNASLKESTTRGWRSALVIGEIALSPMLSVGAGLLTESIYLLHQQKLGINPHNVYTVTTPFAGTDKLSTTQIWNFDQDLPRRVQATPGATSAAVITNLPLTGPDNLPTQQEGHPEHSIGGMEYRAISSQYFQTMRIPVLQGRTFQESDKASATPVVIVSEAVARAWWEGKSLIGDRIVVGEFQGKQFPEVLEQPREVVGVAADVKNLAIDEADPTTVYVPAAQLPRAPGSTD